jgi:hypothetical protein
LACGLTYLVRLRLADLIKGGVVKGPWLPGRATGTMLDGAGRIKVIIQADIGPF